jgi:hypothetical protein
VSRAPWRDPYRAVVQRFNRYGVRYVVVGMAGINYYAKNPSETFATMDYDLFLEPSLSNVEQAVTVLNGLGFTLGTAAGALPHADLRAIVRARTTLIATTPDGLMVELLLRVSGYPFTELARDAATVAVRGVPVNVGRLSKLLRSKRLAGRPKDRQFLRRYQSLLQAGP